MKLRISILYEIARIGFILSVLTHVATFQNMNLQEEVPVVWWLHFGIFLVWVPTVLIAWGYIRGAGWPFFRGIIKRLSPGWMKAACMLLFLYGLANFFYTFYALNEGGTVAEKDGRYVLQNRKGVIRELDRPEYQKHQTYTVRSFSGHWMTFYLLSMTTLYGVKKDQELRDK